METVTEHYLINNGLIPRFCYFFALHWPHFIANSIVMAMGNIYVSQRQVEQVHSTFTEQLKKKNWLTVRKCAPIPQTSSVLHPHHGFTLVISVEAH